MGGETDSRTNWLQCVGLVRSHLGPLLVDFQGALCMTELPCVDEFQALLYSKSTCLIIHGVEDTELQSQ